MKKNYELINKSEIAVIIKMNKGKSYYYPYEDKFEYLEIDLKFSHEDCKPEKWHNEEEWTYRLMRNESDSLANWQGLKSAINYFSESAINEAKKQVKKNLSKLRKEWKESHLNPVYSQMVKLSQDKLTHFKTDLNYHDSLNLYRNNPNTFIWMVRNTGTWLIPEKNSGYTSIIHYELKNNESSWIYFYSNNTFQLIERNQLSEYYQKLNQALS